MILYQGPSLIDGQPIVVIGTKKSNNPKTGNMIQTWILLQDIRPSEAQRLGLDSSICGDCPSRPIEKTKSGAGDCYVTMMAPVGVWKAYGRNHYPMAHNLQDITNFASGHKVRLGSYGDPSAVPLSIWEALLKESQGHTGYTHQWKKDFAQSLKNICMASCDSYDDWELANKTGWRSFRVIREVQGLKLGNREFRCPSDPLLDKHIPCEKCLACNGSDPMKPKKGSPYIVVHGFRSTSTQKKVSSHLQVIM